MAHTNTLWESDDPQLRNWHVETRITDDASRPGSRWEGRTNQTRDEAIAKFAHLRTFPGLHVRLSQHHPKDAFLERVVEVHAPSKAEVRS
jgi:hypothetical protein